MRSVGVFLLICLQFLQPKDVFGFEAITRADTQDLFTKNLSLQESFDKYFGEVNNFFFMNHDQMTTKEETKERLAERYCNKLVVTTLRTHEKLLQLAQLILSVQLSTRIEVPEEYYDYKRGVVLFEVLSFHYLQLFYLESTSHCHINSNHAVHLARQKAFESFWEVHQEIIGERKGFHRYSDLFRPEIKRHRFKRNITIAASVVLLGGALLAAPYVLGYLAATYPRLLGVTLAARGGIGLYVGIELTNDQLTQHEVGNIIFQRQFLSELESNIDLLLYPHINPIKMQKLADQFEEFLSLQMNQAGHF